jgi:AcrR family transcriptional regulator
MVKSSRKIEILDAASKIVNQRGIFNLTLEAVAEEAGISKGGLLYHYPSIRTRDNRCSDINAFR